MRLESVEHQKDLVLLQMGLQPAIMSMIGATKRCLSIHAFFRRIRRTYPGRFEFRRTIARAGRVRSFPRMYCGSRRWRSGWSQTTPTCVRYVRRVANFAFWTAFRVKTAPLPLRQTNCILINAIAQGPLACGHLGQEVVPPPPRRNRLERCFCLGPGFAKTATISFAFGAPRSPKQGPDFRPAKRPPNTPKSVPKLVPHGGTKINAVLGFLKGS